MRLRLPPPDEMDSNIPAIVKSRSRLSIARLACGCARQAWLVLALLALAAPQGVEAAAAWVESVQVPAWIVRNGNRLPVNAGLRVITLVKFVPEPLVSIATSSYE